jgi:hypothetical protein
LTSTILRRSAAVRIAIDQLIRLREVIGLHFVEMVRRTRRVWVGQPQVEIERDDASAPTLAEPALDRPATAEVTEPEFVIADQHYLDIGWLDLGGPLSTKKGKKVKAAMKKTYGEKKGEQVFFASENAGRDRHSYVPLGQRRLALRYRLDGGRPSWY